MEEENKKTEHSIICRPEASPAPLHKRALPTADAINDLTCRELIKAAIGMLEHAYVPYSDFRVGAALMTDSRKIYTGCNIENVAFSPTNCAERTAFFKAISEGERRFRAIAVVGGKHGKIKDYCPPCGVCLQVMREFCRPEDFYVILATSEEDYWTYLLADLLPVGFGRGNCDI